MQSPTQTPEKRIRSQSVVFVSNLLATPFKIVTAGTDFFSSAFRPYKKTRGKSDSGITNLHDIAVSPLNFDNFDVEGERGSLWECPNLEVKLEVVKEANTVALSNKAHEKQVIILQESLPDTDIIIEDELVLEQRRFCTCLVRGLLNNIQRAVECYWNSKMIASMVGDYFLQELVIKMQERVIEWIASNYRNDLIRIKLMQEKPAEYKVFIAELKRAILLLEPVIENPKDIEKNKVLRKYGRLATKNLSWFLGVDLKNGEVSGLDDMLYNNYNKERSFIPALNPYGASFGRRTPTLFNKPVHSEHSQARNVGKNSYSPSSLSLKKR